MVWKSAKKVAFGIRDSNVVAWYCNISSSSLDTNKADADENVGKSCMRLILATNFIDKYDWCFYKRMVKWTNVVRKIHRVPAIAD
jgi:hypothetical protein